MTRGCQTWIVSKGIAQKVKLRAMESEILNFVFKVIDQMTKLQRNIGQKKTRMKYALIQKLKWTDTLARLGDTRIITEYHNGNKVRWERARRRQKKKIQK